MMPQSPEPDPNYQYQKELHAAYQTLRTEADKVALELGGRYEKMLSLLAGGALAVSVTFIEKIAPSPVSESRWIALAAWLLLGGANVATLIAISASGRAQQKKIENMDSEILQKLYPNDPRYQNLNVTENPFVRTVQIANTVSLNAAVFGLICLIIFVFVNFPAPKNHEQKPTNPTAATAAKEARDTNQLIRPNEKSDQPSASTPTVETNQVTMPKTPPSPPPPPSGGKPLTESYVPTKNPVTPPPPPQNPPNKGK